MLFLGEPFDATSTSRGASGASCGRFWHVPTACWSYDLPELEAACRSYVSTRLIDFWIGNPAVRRSLG